jgi:hypothetical protein
MCTEKEDGSLQRSPSSPMLFGEQIARRDYVSYTSRAQKLVDNTRQDYANSEGCPDVRMAHEYANDPKVAHSTGRERLEDIFRAVQFVNDDCFQFSERQMSIMLESYTAASLLQIFGEDIVSELGYLLGRFKLNKLFEEIIVMLERRGGKTVVTAAFVAIMLCTQPQANTNVYGKSKRVSVMMKDLVHDIVVAITRSGKFGVVKIVENNEETLSVLTKYGTVNVGKFYPCNEDVHDSHIF